MCPGETITIKPLITFTHPGAELDLDPDGVKMGKGVNLSTEELLALKELLNGIEL
jgi:hypothetical protein